MSDYLETNKHRLGTLADRRYRPFRLSNDRDGDGIVDRYREALDGDDATLEIQRAIFTTRTTEGLERVVKRLMPPIVGTVGESRAWGLLAMRWQEIEGMWRIEWLLQAIRCAHSESQAAHAAVMVLLDQGYPDPITEAGIACA
jgi:hypothetical protein